MELKRLGKPPRRTAPSQPPARKGWGRTASRGPFPDGENYGKLLGVEERLEKPTGSGHGGVTGEGCRGGRLSATPPELEGSQGSQRGPARPPAPVPGVGLGQRAAAQAGAPPGGAQSPALTQLKAGAAALPCPRPLRWHSPAEVIMAAPCTRSPARSRSQPRRVSVSSGPLAPPRLLTARVPSSSQSPLQAAGSLLVQDPARPGAAHRPACRPARVLPRPASSAPLPPHRPSRKSAHRAPLSSLTLLEVNAPAGWAHSSALGIRLQNGHP